MIVAADPELEDSPLRIIVVEDEVRSGVRTRQEIQLVLPKPKYHEKDMNQSFTWIPGPEPHQIRVQAFHFTKGCWERKIYAVRVVGQVKVLGRGTENPSGRIRNILGFLRFANRAEGMHKQEAAQSCRAQKDAI